MRGYSLRPGDSLIDGALFAITIEQTAGTQLVGPRVFPVDVGVGGTDGHCSGQAGRVRV